jgi:hypothetical protein
LSGQIYFAAYQDKIHVTIPQGLKQTIHGNPDLIIDLPRSRDGIRAGGHIDRVNGHNVNHIIVGDFGALEAVVVCCDDGDVVGFYTHSIQAALKASPEKQSKVRPFFHENVGISAWGLAIHAKSRSEYPFHTGSLVDGLPWYTGSRNWYHVTVVRTPIVQIL